MDLTQFRKEILITTICMAALAELISLPVIGPSLPFGIGVCAGTATTIICFLLLIKIGIERCHGVGMLLRFTPQRRLENPDIHGLNGLRRQIRKLPGVIGLPEDLREFL